MYKFNRQKMEEKEEEKNVEYWFTKDFKYALLKSSVERDYLLFHNNSDGCFVYTETRHDSPADAEYWLNTFGKV